MFSGIITDLGKVGGLRRDHDGLMISIVAPGLPPDTRTGDSIAVNGVCLTARELEADRFIADVMPETTRATTLGDLRPGDPVNLEPALRLGDRLGGHLVTGHVDAVGRVTARRDEENALLLTISLAPNLSRYVVLKGSIAVDGVSLTVARCDRSSFQISIIPHTAELTTLGGKRPGDPVNLETDLFGKYVARLWDENGPPPGLRPGAGGPSEGRHGRIRRR